MKKQCRENMDVYDYNDHARDVLDEWLGDFTYRDGLTREPTEEDFDAFGEEFTGWMCTQKGMELYNRACKRLYDLGAKLFPNNINELNIESSVLLFP